MLSANGRHIRPARNQVFLLPANGRHIRPARNRIVVSVHLRRHATFYYYSISTTMFCQTILDAIDAIEAIDAIDAIETIDAIDAIETIKREITI